jgi:hypothetical protein
LGNTVAIEPGFDLPGYRGTQWVDAALPTLGETWPRQGELFIAKARAELEMSAEEIGAYLADKPWVWPTETVNFLCDVHADAGAFFSSLVATGSVERTGPSDADFEITNEGREAVFVIGGDCLDKGPSNLRFLRALRGFMTSEARVELLAGNHDLRTMLGLLYVGAKDPRHAHLFVRMGQKSLRLFQEVYEEFIAGSGTPIGSEASAMETLYPTADWYETFPKVVRGLVPPKKLLKELIRIREKQGDMIALSRRAGMSQGMLLAALRKCRELYLSPGGEFYWLFNEMKLAFRAGSFVFIHAGFDDVTACLLREEGIDGLNRTYAQLVRDDPFELYNGPIGNTFRTKYRDIDFPFSERGMLDLHSAGIYAVVHGHRNLLRGQRIMMRGGMLNFECDSSVDANTRRLERLKGSGGAATLVRPDCRVLGISTDYPRVKVFDPSQCNRTATFVRSAPPPQRTSTPSGMSAPTQAGT